MSARLGRSRRRWLWLVGIVTLIVLIVADRQGWLLVRTPRDLATYHGVRARVTRVIDCATIEVEIPDPLHGRPQTRVRLWGLNCPRRGGPDWPAEPLAKEATALAGSLAEGQIVTLNLESQRPRGGRGWILAHVELPDGSALNEALLAAGLATVDERWPHSRLGRYARLERVARREGLGIWGEN